MRGRWRTWKPAGGKLWSLFRRQRRSRLFRRQREN